MFCLFQHADSPPWGLSGSNLLAVQTHSFQSHDSVALFRPCEDLIILEIILLARPTWRKLNYLNVEQSASPPGGRSEAGAPEQERNCRVTGSSMCNFRETADFHSSCTASHSHRPQMRAPISPHPHRYLLFSGFWFLLSGFSF